MKALILIALVVVGCTPVPDPEALDLLREQGYLRLLAQETRRNIHDGERLYEFFGKCHEHRGDPEYSWFLRKCQEIRRELRSGL